MVSISETTGAQLRSNVVGAAYVVAASIILAFLLFSPETSSGKYLSQPHREYQSLLALMGESDTTGEKRGEDVLRVPGKFRETDTGFRLDDTTDVDTTHADTTVVEGVGTPQPADTAYVVFLDSTARLEHFTHIRRDGPQAQFFHDRTHPLFSNSRPSSYQRLVAYDSATMSMQARETILGKDVRIPVSIRLQEYVVMRRKWEIRKLFADEARKPKVLGQRDDLGELLTNITQIHIPVPANPIFSIFGKPEIKLNISGAVDIKAGFRNTKSDQTQLSRLDQSRNEPDFSQEVQVNVNGTIGDKLNILADWNTQRTFEYENQLKIKYTGYPDEIVQSVEAGNVSLQTPSSFVGSSQALFGVKAKFQTGPLTLTTLASQKKGQIKEVSVSGGVQEVPFEIRAYNYATNHFFVDTSYIRHYEPYYQVEPPAPDGSIQIVEEEVWVQRTGSIPDPNERQAIAFIDLPARGGPTSYDSLRNAGVVDGRVERGGFVRLERAQYELAGDGYIGVLSLNTNVQDQQIIAISYRRANGQQFGELSRDIGTDTTGRPLVLKMVKPKNLLSTGPNYAVAWRMLLKNVYSVGGRNIKKAGFQLDILRRVPGGEDENSIVGQPLLQVLGVDKYNVDDTPSPTGDGEFDFRPGRTVSQPRAEIFFPYLRPFDEGIKAYFAAKGLPPPDTSLIYSEIYDTTKTFAQQSSRDQYAIRGKATGEATSKYSLGFNVVEGSVVVLLDGRPLVPNLDYSVDYIIGEVVIRNDRALVPGANLQIKYEQNDLFQLASKTLLGARGDLAISQKTNLGFTVMNLNQQTLSDKVRLGEEPNKNTIFGFDGATSINVPFLTSAINAMPLLQTREPSELKVSGEAAYMLPDPNTRKSTIPSDGGQGIAYIDDFEGARRSIPIGINYAQWTQASPPVDEVSNQSLGEADTTKMLSKGKMIWFNRLPTDVRLTDVFPLKEPGNAANNQITVLDFQYFPLARGQFNYSTDLPNTLTPLKNWAGVMKTLSISGTNLINENINFIELWVQVNRPVNPGPNDKLIIDLGSISERVIPNGVNSTGTSPNSEDLVLSTTPNGTLQEGEDVGLDMLTNAQEIARYGDLRGDGDPSGDDYFFNNTVEDYSRINGTENSKNSPSGLIPDTEDLNSNGIADEANSYFQYEIPLDTVRSRNPLIVGGGFPSTWFQLRIPIRDFTRKVGSPNFENVEFVRAFFRNITDTIAIRIADFSLVGNQWQELRKEDTTFAVSVVSVEDNPEYTSPPGVIREQDRTRPDERVLANEQSLALLLNGIPAGESRMAVKYYTLRPLDVFNYKTMKMFVHGDPGFNYYNENLYDAELFFRFGLDSLNFYEYRAPIHKGWDPLNDVEINFSEITAIKQDRDSINVLSPPKPVKNGPPGSTYRVRGNPSLTQVRYLALGVTHMPSDLRPRPLLFGQVWVNELRLTSVDDSPGWAYRFDTQLKMADLGTVGFNYSKVDPHFHTLEQRFGSRQTGINWGLNANVQLEKFFPNDWAGTSIPFSYSHTENLIRPKYLPNSDVLVSEAAELQRQRTLRRPGATQAEADAEAARILFESETYRVTDTYAAPTFRLGLPSQEWYIRDTFNKLTFGFTYTKSTERSPAIIRRLAWQWNARLAYALTLSPDYHFAPFKSLFDGIWLLDEYKNLKIYYAPASFSWSFSATRSRDVSLQRTVGAQEIISRNFTASRQFGFGWKLTEGGLLNLSGDYGLNIESSLLDFELDSQKRQRSFSKIIGDIFFSERFINFGQDTRYSQRNQFNSKPNIPNILNIKKYLDISLGYGVDYNWQNTLTSGDLGKSAGFTNNINLTTNFKLKQLFDPLFESGPSATPPAPRGRRGGSEQVSGQDTVQTGDTTSTQGESGFSRTMAQLGNLARILIKIPFLDYENINVTFTQSNSAQNSGVVGRPGFVNFWGRIPFFQDADPKYGPSRLYQLGLISDPHGKLVGFGARPHFPFFGWEVEPGIRAPRGVLVNNYRQTNRLAFRTNRALWEGARLDLNWNIGWSYNRTQNLTTDSLGFPTITNTTTSGSIERSFLTFPDVLFLGMFKSSLKEVSKKYAELKSNRDTTVSDEEKLSRAFEEGFEALPFLRKLFGQYYPRLNWSLRWDGLEKLSMFSGFVSRLSLDHSYSSSYTRQYINQPGGGGERTNGQRVSYGFSPLVGLNFTFKELFKGNLGANFRYNTNTSFDLATSSRNLVENLAQEISITASYSRRGFEIPLFGLALNNDLDISASYSVTKNSRQTYDITKLDVNIQGTPLEGSTRTVLEPRIKYVLSSRVTASIYYRYTKISPDASGSRIPGSTTNEAGLDIHISIQ